MNVKDMCLAALFAAVVAVCGYIAIPAPVPFTLQTLGVFLAALLLGGRRGLFAVGLYLLLGAAGLPVFSGFRGGFGALLGPTGGFLWGFLAIPGAAWLLGPKRPAAALLLGLLVCYALGGGWYAFVFLRNGAGIGFGAALAQCVLPFLLPDALKLALALILARRLGPRLARQGRVN